jgi:type IV pilus assembly protein PilX
MTAQKRIVLPRLAAARRQKGAALVVGLMLLMVLTLLAISGMNTATLELQMAGNAQYSENAFQASETGIEQALREAKVNGVNTANVDPEKTLAMPGSTIDKYKILTTHTPENGVTKVPSGGYSMGVGAYHFDVTSTGTSSRSAVETHVQGFYIVAQSAK